jgi:Protein of unknown function (DUF2874).
MKQVIALLFGVLLNAGAFAFEPDPNEKVLKAFNETFSGAQEVKWEEYPTYYTVSFVNAGIRSKVNYDKDGNMTGSIRYYSAKMLPLNILNKIKREYPKKELFGVTEVTFGSDVNYHVKLEDEKRWYTIKVDASGHIQMTEKYKKI